MYPCLSLLVSSEGAHRQRPNNARCCFCNFLEIWRFLDRGGDSFTTLRVVGPAVLMVFKGMQPTPFLAAACALGRA